MAPNGLDPITLRLVVDTAALTLIWLVQLVIYPAFLHFQRAGFRVWHQAYTKQVTLVVMPIMLGQLAAYAYLLLSDQYWQLVVNMVLILLAWAVTFFRAVPLHGLLDREEDHLPLSAQLVSVNWWRTILWSMVWVVSILEGLGIFPE